MRPSARWLVSLVVLAFLGIVPAANASTTVTYTATQGLTITGDDAANGISVSPNTSGYQVFISNGSAFSGGGCSQGPPTGAGSIPFDCPVTGIRAVSVTAAGANDGVGISALAGDTVTVNLGDGNDDYSSVASVAAVTVDGGNGNDDISGSQGNDTLTGGPGRDSFFGLKGIDVMQGGDDDDDFFASARTNPVGTITVPNPEDTPQPDVMSGGPGVDTVLYNFTPEPVTVSLDSIANDGRAGENDNAIVENVVGGQGANTITGNALANTLSVSICCSGDALNGNDVIHGGDGPDRIGGGRGDDQLFGEGDNDIIFGGPDDDMIDGGAGVDDLRDEFQSGVVINAGPNGGNDPSTVGSQGLTPGDDTIFGGPGADLINTREGTDVTHGGDDPDTIQAAAQNATTGGTGMETVFGDDGDDKITGSGTATTVIRIEGNDGNDEIHGAGMTIEIGGIGDDQILNFSGSGPDTIEGNSGNDVIESGTSGQGVDNVNGGTGDDTIGNLVASGSITGSDVIQGGPGADDIDVRQRPPNASDASVDTVDCGRNIPRRDDDGDTLEKNVVDTAVVNCENVTNSPYGENVDVSVPDQTLAVPRRGRVEVDVHCIRKFAPRGGCKGTIRLGSLAVNGNAGPPGPKQHFQIDRGETETLLVPIRDGDRAKLRNKANERARVETIQPGQKGPHTTIRALQAKKE